MKYDLPPWLTLAAPVAVGAVILGALLLAGKVPLRYNLRNLRVRWRTMLSSRDYTFHPARVTAD